MAIANDPLSHALSTAPQLPAQLATRIAPMPLAWQAFECIDSTQKWLLAHPSDDPTTLQVCLARTQTQGVGRRQTPWQSPKDAGIWCSIAALIGDRTLPWSLMIASDIARVMQAYDFDIQLKWPNDILIAGKKCAGIVIDVSPSAQHYRLVIGFGINLLAHPNLPTTSTALTAHQPINSSDFFLDIIAVLAKRLLAAERPWLDLWQQHLLGQGQTILFQHAQGDVQGQLHGIGEDGALEINNGSLINSFHQGRYRLP